VGVALNALVQWHLCQQTNCFQPFTSFSPSVGLRSSTSCFFSGVSFGMPVPSCEWHTNFTFQHLISPVLNWSVALSTYCSIVQRSHSERHRLMFVAFALSTFHFRAIHFGPRPYIVLVLSVVFVEYILTCRSLKPDGEPLNTFRHWGSRWRVFLVEIRKLLREGGICRVFMPCYRTSHCC
jgi:hypothetical protein